MFGTGRQIEELRARVEALDERLARVDTQTAAARPLLEDAVHLEDLAERADRLSHAAEATLAGIQSAAAAVGMQQPRSRPAMNVVHRADVLGYLSLYFNGGYTDDIQLLVGAEDPPTEIVCEANTRNDINSYAGAIIRPGEYWMARSKKGESSGFECVFTPLF